MQARYERPRLSREGSASMKGPLESRHTSSERRSRRPRARPAHGPIRACAADPVGRAPRTGARRSGRCLISRRLRATDSSFTRLFAPSAGRTHSQLGPRAAALGLSSRARLARARRHGSCGSSPHARGEDVVSGLGATPVQSRHTSGAQSATRAFCQPMRRPSCRAQRPTASWRLTACRAASTKAHRTHGAPSRVMRPL